MEENKRLLAVFVLGLATLFTVLIALEDTDPFPINPGTAVQMVYQVNPFGESGQRIITDSDVIGEVIACLNATKRSEPERGTAFDRSRVAYEVMFLRPEGGAWSLRVWLDRLEISSKYGARRMADCTQLCGLLEEIWRAHKSGESE